MLTEEEYEQLDAVLDLFLEGGWTRRIFWRDAFGKTTHSKKAVSKCCLLGAIQFMSGTGKLRHPIQGNFLIELVLTMELLDLPFKSLVPLNDLGGKDLVIGLIEETLDRNNPY